MLVFLVCTRKIPKEGVRAGGGCNLQVMISSSGSHVLWPQESLSALILIRHHFTKPAVHNWKVINTYLGT